MPGASVRQDAPSQMQPPTDRIHVSAEQFGALFRTVSAWGRWGDDDDRGALNHITPERVAAAAGLVREGVSVTLSHPLNTVKAADNPEPADHRMTAWGGSGPLSLAKDYVGVDYHNDTHTHIDALCHVGYEGSLYNGTPADAVTSAGAAAQSIEALKDGLVGRGVMLDIPRLRGVRWLEPGDSVFRDELEAAEREHDVTVREGDILLVRTGHARRLRELGPWETAAAKAGLHPTAVTFLSERGVAALGTDTNGDTAPSSTEGVGFPIHVLALAAMGVHLLDYLQFEELRPVCERTGRWEFFFVAAPLRIAGGTGSPLNPIAVL
jgi:kynurenine formamidase